MNNIACELFDRKFGKVFAIEITMCASHTQMSLQDLKMLTLKEFKQGSTFKNFEDRNHELDLTFSVTYKIGGVGKDESSIILTDESNGENSG